jgi:DNA-binding PadR family transcriptional regulator
MVASTPRGPLPARVLRLYALATLDREGTLYGYSLAERIASKTDGAWRPGPGAIYPALQSLVTKGWARSTRRATRRVYSITPAGHAMLRRLRSHMAGGGPGAPDLSLLWAEIAGSADAGEHMLRHLRRHLDSLDAYLARVPDARLGNRSLRSEVLAELAESMRRLDGPRTASRAPARRGRRGG